MAAASSAASKTCGVIILIRRKLPFSIEIFGGDTDGHISAGLIEQTSIVKLALASLYAPNEFDLAFSPENNRISIKLLEPQAYYWG